MNGNPHQHGLFDAIDGVTAPSVDTSEITGLQYIPDFIDQQVHDQLLCSIDAQPWLADLKRRVQHYGYKYDYKARRVDQTMRIGLLPEWSVRISDDLEKRGLMPELPDQLIVNE